MPYLKRSAELPKQDPQQMITLRNHQKEPEKSRLFPTKQTQSQVSPGRKTESGGSDGTDAQTQANSAQKWQETGKKNTGTEAERRRLIHEEAHLLQISISMRLLLSVSDHTLYIEQVSPSVSRKSSLSLSLTSVRAWLRARNGRQKLIKSGSRTNTEFNWNWYTI